MATQEHNDSRPCGATFRDLLEAVPDALVVSDEQGRILLVNSQTERLFRYPREQLIQQPLELLIPRQFRARHAEYRKEYIAAPRPRPMGLGLELLAERADGSEFPAEISLSTLRTDKGMLVFSAIRDVTERKQSENALKQTAAELTRANAELKQFAYAVSHDLQEPLRTVVGATQILMGEYAEKLAHEAKEWLGFAVDGAKRMQELLNALLDYSRVGAERPPFELVDLERIYQFAVDNLKMAITESGAELSHGPLPIVMGNRVQLIQLVQNLIDNAIKFRRQQPPRIHISAQQQEKEWRVAVTDNGIGIDPRNFGALFSLFHRLHTREQYRGTGIGLAMCKKIVESHGGRIGVESAPGEGSTFSFTIPVVNPESLPAPLNSAPLNP